MRRRIHRSRWAMGWAATVLVAGLLPAHAVTPGEATDLLVTGYNAGTGELSLSYSPACSASDHHIEFGPLEDVGTLNYTGQDCGIGAGGSYGSFDPGAGSYFFLVVGDDGAGIEGSYGTDLIAGVETERPENLLDPQCALVQDLSQRCDGPFVPALDLTVFRPASSPLQRTAVPESMEESPGAGIRINGDDDNGNGQPDRDDTGVAGENDLLEVVLSVDPVTPPAGYEYVLIFSNQTLALWNEPTKATAVSSSGNTAVLTFTSGTRTVWVENPAGGSAGLELAARATSDGAVAGSDVAHLYPFSGIIIALGGEDQVPADPPLEPDNHGVFQLAITLYGMGYDVHMYDEDVVPPSGAGVAFDEVVSAVSERGVSSVTIFGYSHGAGSTNDLAALLDFNRASIGTFTIDYTAYIDGIDNDSDYDITKEDQLPPSTLFHDNYYETICSFFGVLCGQSIAGADFNLDINTTPWGAGLAHFEIDDAPEVLQGILDRILALSVNP